MNQNNQNPFNQSKPKKKRAQNVSFVEALKSIGSSTASSFKDDLISGTARDALNSTISPGSSTTDSFPNTKLSPDMFRPETGWQHESDIAREQQKQQRHKEMNLEPVYDRRQEEIKAQIKALREELAALAADLGKMGLSMQKAIEEEIEHPGTYHVNFFEKLRKFIINLRKQVNESSNWLEISSQRKAAKNHYWGNVKKSGTKYMLSHDRTVATQTG